MIGWIDLIIPSTACLEAQYIAALGIAIQDAMRGVERILRAVMDIDGDPTHRTNEYQ